MNKFEYKTPGQLISALIESKGWNNRILAAVLEVDEPSVSKIISAKKPVTAEMAILLEEIFDLPADDFLSLQKSYDLAKARIVARPNPTRASRAKIFAELPISEMMQRNWLSIQDIKDASEVEIAVNSFFGTDDFAKVDAISHAAKKTDAGLPVTPAQLAWLYRVKKIAEQMLVPTFSHEKTVATVSKLKSLLSAPEEARHAVKLLMECGIRLVFVEGLKSSKIDGACLWLNENSPVIGMTLRYDRMDNFWFVLRHELEHVIQRHGVTSPMIDIDIGAETVVADDEIVANNAAADFCASSAKIESFIARKAPLFPERDFLGLAKILGVHPSLVAGQIQFKTKRFELFRSHLVKIRHCVLPSAIVDGWGDVAPLVSA